MTEEKQGASVISLEDFAKMVATNPHQTPVSDEVFEVLEENAINFYNFILPKIGAILSFINDKELTEESKKFLIEKGTRTLRIYDLLLSQRAFPKKLTIQVTIPHDMHLAIQNVDTLAPLHTMETALKALWSPEVAEGKELQEKYIFIDHGNFSIEYIRQVTEDRYIYNVTVDTVLAPRQYAEGVEAHLTTPITPGTVKGNIPFVHEDILKND